MKYNINLHSHSIHSDGVLLPSEIAVRYAVKGYKLIAITDHTDYSNIESNIKAMRDFTQNWPRNSFIKVLPGIELTHLPLCQFKPLTKYARENGIKVIVAHGQTPVEPVIEGTNTAALEAVVDILAHPGFISDKDIKLAKKMGIRLEISSRKGHCLGNTHLVRRAKALGAVANLILDTDSHMPEDIITPGQLMKVGLKAGLSSATILGIRRSLEEEGL